MTWVPGSSGGKKIQRHAEKDEGADRDFADHLPCGTRRPERPTQVID